MKLMQAGSDEVAVTRPAGGPDWTLWGVLAVALVLRVAAIVAFPSLHHPDENFQLFEQAHRIAFGYGVVPWEFVIGIRSPVLPLILAGIFRLAAPLVGGPEGYLFVARLLLALSSLVGVGALYRMGRRTSPTHALITGLVAATWFEIVYFADRPLTEAVATTVLLVALSLASVPDQALTWRRLLWLGFSISLCLLLRVQLATGLFVIALWVGRMKFRRRWWPMALGGLFPLIVFGVADWITWGGFFHTYFTAFRVNVIQGVASTFGTAPAGAYARWMLVQWRYAFPVLWALIVVRGRLSALWIVAALVIIATHSAIPHKEYRFVFPAFACLVIVAAMGSADLLQMARHRLAPVAVRSLVAAVAMLWVATSATLGFTPPFRYQWFKGRGDILASFAAARQPDLCGLLFYNKYWFATGGYAFLHRDVPIYFFNHRELPQLPIRSIASFNAVVLDRAAIPQFAKDFQLRRCFAVPGSHAVCLMQRAGGCRHQLAMNVFLAPNMSWPAEVPSNDSGWAKSPPGRVWHVRERDGPQVWTRRGTGNVYDVTGCGQKSCHGKTVSILRSGNEVMVLQGVPGSADTQVHLGVISGAHVAGWYPGGAWHAAIEE